MSGHLFWLALLAVLVLRWLRPWPHHRDEDLTPAIPTTADPVGKD